jgi:uncharacterized protein (UPF0210 family)
MKLRSITCFIHSPLEKGAIEAAGAFAAAARQAYQSAGFTVQTVRLATSPFAGWFPSPTSTSALRLVRELEGAAGASGFEYLSLGPALPDELSSFDLIPELLAVTQSIFLSGLMTLDGGGVSLPAVRRCAAIIAQVSALSLDGFTNLRFAALANVPAGTPFFPAAYHSGMVPAFALATEAADLAVDAFQMGTGPGENTSLSQARQALVDSFQAHARRLEHTADSLERDFGFRFGGIDFSPGPFPDDTISLGAAIEWLGVPQLGMHGSLAAAAVLAEAIDRAQFRKAGFNGLMLPVLEDSRLALRAAEGALSVKDLLLFSAVCGAGLDTVPLPGDTSADELAGILLDVAVLAQRLGKPLTARLMPVPGKSAGDPTDFRFAYFANSRVLPVQSGSLTRYLAGDEVFNIHKRELP